MLPRLVINTALARRILVLFLRDAVRKTGFQRAVVGLSGGLDSAVVTYLLAEALGPENVLAIRMPYRTSSQASLDDGQAVIDALGVTTDTVDITPMVDPLLERFPTRRACQGNIMARMRMIVLYDQSAATDALVIGTSNKTEFCSAIRRCSDNAAAVQPIADLYKTQVRQLARDLGVPRQIEKPPSADLWADQTDEGELGFTYGWRTSFYTCWWTALHRR